jgi:arylsulfatase A-like enzyme
LGIDTRMPPVYADARAVTDTALGSLGTRAAPFFLWLHYMDVHWPFHLEAEIREARELARSWRDLRITHQAGVDKQDPSEEHIERLRSLYRLAIAGVDREIGRLLRAISEEGLAERTVVVLTSDHGEAFFEHGVFGHAGKHLYDEILHVPLIVTGPGVREGRTERIAVQHLDVAPTLLELAGQPTAEAMLGRSLVPLLRGGSLAPRPYDIAETVGTRLIWVAVAGRRYKLIWLAVNPSEYQVYDLARDPGEATDLRGRYPEVEEELLAVAGQHQAFVEASQREAAEAPDLDETMLRRLAALGYVE